MHRRRTSFPFGCLAIAIGSCACPQPDSKRARDQESVVYDQEFTTEIIVLEHASAADVVRTLEEVMSESRRAAAKRVAPGSCVLYPPGAQPLEPRPSLRVEVFANSNAVRIRARPDDLPRIRDLIARLDGVYPNHRISESREPR